MRIPRRLFVKMVGALGVGSLLPRFGSARGAGSASPSYEEIRSLLAGKKLFFVPYCHNDYGWLNSNRWDRARAPLVHSEALEILGREENFKWFMDVKFEAFDWLLERHPELLDDLKLRVGEKRLGIAPGTFCNPDNPFMEAESMIRNITVGRRYFEKTFPGVNLEVAIFNDIHPGHTQIPQLLNLGGYRYYRITRPQGALDKKGYPREFVWEGLDGSEVLFSFGSYGWGWVFKEDRRSFDELNGYQDDWERAVEVFYESAVKDIIDKSPTGILYLPVGTDYARPLRLFFEILSDEPYADLPGFVKEWGKRESTPLAFATPVDFFHEVDKVRDSLPRVDGMVDPVGWPFWYGNCGSEGLDNWRERTTRDLVEAEIFASMASHVGSEFPEAQIESLWNEKLTLDPHDGLFVGDEDVMELIEVGRQVGRSCDLLGRKNRRQIGDRIAVKPEKQATALFNVLSWSHNEVVEVHAVFPDPGIKKIRVVDASGAVLPHQIIKVRHMGRHELFYREARVLVEAEVPPCGYKTIYIEPAEGAEEPRYLDEPVEALDSRFARLQLGSSGIETLQDKVRQVTYRSAGNPVYYSTTETWRYHSGPIGDKTNVRDAEWKLVEEGALRTSAEMTGMVGEHAVRMRVSLYHTLERIDFDLTVDSKGGEGFMAIELPFDYPGNLHAGIPFGVESRDLSNEPFGPEAGLERIRENVFYAHHWVDYSDGDKGITIIAAEAKRGFRFDPHNRTLDHIVLMTIIPQPETETNDHHVHQGEMETRFTNRFFRGTGRHRFQYSLIPHDGDWRAAGSLHRAQELLYPTQWKHVYPRSGANLPESHSFLRAHPESVVLSSWFQTDGNHYLRFYESTGRQTAAEIALEISPGRCRAVDFNGRPTEGPQIRWRGKTLRFDLAPWQIVTLKIET